MLLYEETKILLRLGISEAMARAQEDAVWDRGAHQLLEILESGTRTRVKPSEATVEGLTAKTDDFFIDVLEKQFFPVLWECDVSYFKAETFMEWIEKKSTITLNEGDMRCPVSGRPEWRTRVHRALMKMRDAGRIERMPRTKYFYLTPPRPEEADA